MEREGDRHDPVSRRVGWLRAAIGTVIGPVILGCAACQSGPAGPPASVQMRVGEGEWREVSATQMTRDLQLFVNEFTAEVSGTASEIAATTSDRRVREMTLLWRLRTIPVIENAVLIADPRQGLVAMWLMCAEQRRYLTNGRGRTIFGECQDMAVEAVNALDDRIREVARRYYTDEQVADAETEIDQYAEASPVTAVFELYDPLSIDHVESVGAMQALLSIPLAPFQAVENIGTTAQEIYRVSLTGLAFTHMLESLPERIRWQSELLMLDLESGETLTELRRSVTEASSSMASFAQTAEALPTSLRREFETALDSLDTRQQALGQTVDKAATAAADLRAATDNVQSATEVWNDKLGETRALVQDTSNTAEALQASAGAVREVIDSIDRLVVSTRADEREGAPPFDINDYTRTAEEIGRAAAELSTLLRDAQAADLSRLRVQYDEATRATLDYAEARTEVIVNKLTLRLVIILVVVIAAMMIYRLVTARVARPST